VGQGRGELIGGGEPAVVGPELVPGDDLGVVVGALVLADGLQVGDQPAAGLGALTAVGGIKPGVVLIAGGAIADRSWEGGDISCRRGGRWSQVVAVISRVPADFSWRLRTEALRLRDAAAYRDRLRSALTDAGRGVRCRERVADFAGRDGADARERPR
jgi:hypothetical protein